MSNGTHPISPSTTWSIVGSPSPGTVSALAVGKGESETIFAGTRPGLYRAHAADNRAHTRWQKLPAAPLDIIALATSPSYATDTMLLAGTGSGIFLSHDGGESWQTTETPMPDPVVLCVAFSPNYAADGIILAGTLEDGLYFSDNRGERWSVRSVGILDAAVYSLVFSPDFAQDETVFAGTESALYTSYNGARAWKQLDFPEEAAPILSLTLSPHFAQDQVIFAGTEAQGLWRSSDLGKSWQQLDFPASTVNALITTPEDGKLYAATENGLYASSDQGRSWHCLLSVPDAFAFALTDQAIVVSLVNQGAWCCQRHDLANWQPIFTLPARSLTGMLLSPHFAHDDPRAFLFGAQEDLWRTEDGGLTWEALSEGLADVALQMMALSPNFATDQVVLAASPDGLRLSQDAGAHWSLWLELPVAQVAFSADGRLVAVALSNGEIQIAEGLQDGWQTISTPWRRQVQPLALTIDNSRQLRVALFDPTQEMVAIYESESGQFIQRLNQPASPDSLVNFWVPPADSSTSVWYASLDNKIWAFQQSNEDNATPPELIFESEEGSKILSLLGYQTENGVEIVACTGQLIYQAKGGSAGKVIHDFGDERAVVLALSPEFPHDRNAFALLLGGLFCRGNL